MLCVDIKDAENKVVHNYHLVSLKMLGNIYQTASGRDFVMEDHASSSILDFCSYSLGSSNPKTVHTAAVLLFNHILCYKRDINSLCKQLVNVIMTIIEILAGAYKAGSTLDNDSITAMLLCEIRMLYKN